MRKDGDLLWYCSTDLASSCSRLRFSNKSLQAPSSEWPKTTPRTLFLSFEINNCFPITAECRAATQHKAHVIPLTETLVLYIFADNKDDGKNRLSIINLFK